MSFPLPVGSGQWCLVRICGRVVWPTTTWLERERQRMCVCIGHSDCLLTWEKTDRCMNWINYIPSPVALYWCVFIPSNNEWMGCNFRSTRNLHIFLLFGIHCSYDIVSDANVVVYALCTSDMGPHMSTTFCNSHSFTCWIFSDYSAQQAVYHAHIGLRNDTVCLATTATCNSSCWTQICFCCSLPPLIPAFFYSVFSYRLNSKTRRTEPMQ